MRLLFDGRNAKKRADWSAAKKAFESAAAADPGWSMPWANLGSLAAEDGLLDEAIAAFEEAKKREPKEAGFDRQLDDLQAIKKRGGGLQKTPRLDEVELEAKCRTCHPFPEPSSLPADAWGDVMGVMQSIGVPFGELKPDDVARWYAARAPRYLPVPEADSPGAGAALKLSKTTFAPKPAAGHPAISNVAFWDVIGDSKAELIATDMRSGAVMLARPYTKSRTMTVIAQLANPAHSALCDLDGDGKRDLVIADLGSFEPGDHTNGRVVWLRGNGKGQFETIVIAEGLGRITDAEPADLDGDGDQDLVVAEYGSRMKGRLLALENKGNRQFVLHEVEARGGGIHVPIIDLNGDKLPDFISVHAEHHEMITAHRNLGNFSFEHEIIQRAPHPAWGYTGMQLVDIDRDGDKDILVTNGDGFDSGGLLQPFHGVQLLINLGSGRFSPRAPMPFRGATRAEAGDMDGDGDMDIVAVAFQPFLTDDIREQLHIDSIVWFENVGNGQFERRAVERRMIERPTLAIGDFDNDGDADLAAGVFTMKKISPEDAETTSGGIWKLQPDEVRSEWVDVWKNEAR